MVMAWQHSRLGSERGHEAYWSMVFGTGQTGKNHTFPQLCARPLDGSLLFHSKRVAPSGDCWAPQFWKQCCARSLQPCPTRRPMDCSPPGSSVHGILQARIVEWVAMPSSGGSSQPRKSNPYLWRLFHCRQFLYPLSPLGSPLAH